MFRNALISGAAIAAAFSICAPAQAATYFADYVTAQAPDGFTEIPVFAAPGGTLVDFHVVDCCIVGDNYTAYLDGVNIGTTPAVALYGPTLSEATFQGTLGPGASHSFYLQDQILSILPAGVYVEINSAAPEPAAWALMMVGVGGMGAALRTRRRKAVAA